MSREFVIRSGGDVFTLPDYLPDGIEIKRVDVSLSANFLEVTPPIGKKLEGNLSSRLLGNLESITVRQDTFGDYWIV